MLWVKYFVEYRTANSVSVWGTMTSDPANGWDAPWDWTHIHNDGKHTIWAEAMDNEGAKTVSPKITVTLHPAK